MCKSTDLKVIVKSPVSVMVTAPSDFETWEGCQTTAQFEVIVSLDCEVRCCVDASTYNYNPSATIDDGLCVCTEGRGTGNGCERDLTCDNVINASDLPTLLSNFGNTCN